MPISSDQTKKIKTLLVLQDHRFHGGAARAANRWSDLLRDEDCFIQQVAGDMAEGKGIVLTGKPPRGWGRLLEYFHARGGARKTKVNQRLKDILENEAPSLVWFHNIAGGGKWGWSEQMVMQARQYAPVLWTLHDMWGLGNGDKTYWEVNSSVESGRWKGVGGSGQGARLQKVCGAAEKYPIQLTAPSRWLAELASKVTGQRCSFLHNPIDLSIFCPGDRVAARRRLGLPDQGMIILAGADSLQDRRKGFDLLREAWTLAGKHGVTLALFGRHAENRPGERYLGNLSSGGEMVAAFRAADLYVHPARMENAPCQIQESLACGTPVLAFPVGGIPEMIAPGRTGFLADKVSPESLHGALTSVLSNPSRLSGMREECRKTAEVVWRPQSLLEQFEEVAGAVVSGW